MPDIDQTLLQFIDIVNLLDSLQMYSGSFKRKLKTYLLNISF